MIHRLAPQPTPARAAAILREVFGALPGPFAFRVWDGTEVRLGPGMPVATAVIKSPEAFVRLMRDPSPGNFAEAYVDSVFGVMHLADWHVYQVLTKRADRMRHVLTRRDARGRAPDPHVWLGVSVENKKHGLPRIDELRRTPAAIRFLSVEPLLEDIGSVDLDGIDWVIVGGESGPGARPMQPEWVLSILEQCSAASVPFFFKQWGGVQKGKHGRELEGRTWNEIPALPRLPVPSSAERKRRRLIIEMELVENG